mgnify:CR=1 FL=1
MGGAGRGGGGGGPAARGGAAFRGVDEAAQRRLNAQAPEIPDLGARVMALFRPYLGRIVVTGILVVAGAAIGVAFQFVFDPRYGLIQYFLNLVSIPVPNFYQDPDWALAMITITYIWKNLGYSFVIYLAALQAKPAELYEAAEIDGASRNQQFWRITLPLLTPVIFFNLIMGIIGSFQVFDTISDNAANAGIITGGRTVRPFD